ncbi:hypothetical protein JHK82_018947 [Glycine max]|uniref:Uncharacterized protein n=1 Tax=Glycine max TaxID=3847 RepID=K7L2B6_SOYBN|nr:hypothetical protein JHK87_018822 [Glycine soja]KAG5023043.1 hypothetical protein JHK85_019385 [Glycine max]KAG5038123.1 hypothetical protein JHK86_018963 [Glycine max]KAG5143252.1 hypothetical protein JHK82_018947 [Glycine max]KAH1087279.1 hypothetical protein GYH30_018704 [Glycine max]
MFYFFFESQSSKNDCVVISLTRGPRCSNELGLFCSNGPFQLTKNLSLEWNDYGWDKHPSSNPNPDSYAGHYSLALASRVHQGNKTKEGIHIYKSKDRGLVKKANYDSINKLIPPCKQAIEAYGTEVEETCVSSLYACNKIFNWIMTIAYDVNYYDIRKKCVGDLCYNFFVMEDFLNKKL